MEELKGYLEGICRKADEGKFDEYNESQISQEFILPILRILGWDIENAMEVYPEFSTDFNFRIDFALDLNKKHKVLIEAKRNTVELDAKVEKQLEKYVLESPDKNIVGVLTNGFMWKLYVYNENNERIELVKIIIIEKGTCESASKTLWKFLSKKEVENENAVKNLRELKKRKTELDSDKIIEEGWSYLFSNDFLQNELAKLVNYEILLSKGFSIDENELRKFIDKKLQPIIPTKIPHKSKFKGNIRINTQSGKRSVKIYTSAETFEYSSMKAAISDFVKDISFNNPEILEKYYVSDKNHGNKHKYITKTFDEATSKRNLSEANGWYINVDLANEKVFDYLWKPLCDLLGKYSKFDLVK